MTFKLTRECIPTVELGFVFFMSLMRNRTLLLFPTDCRSRRWTDTASDALISYGKYLHYLSRKRHLCLYTPHASRSTSACVEVIQELGQKCLEAVSYDHPFS